MREIKAFRQYLDNFRLVILGNVFGIISRTRIQGQHVISLLLHLIDWNVPIVPSRTTRLPLCVSFQDPCCDFSPAKQQEKNERQLLLDLPLGFKEGKWMVETSSEFNDWVSKRTPLNHTSSSTSWQHFHSLRFSFGFIHSICDSNRILWNMHTEDASTDKHTTSARPIVSREGLWLGNIQWKDGALEEEKE